MSTIVHVLIPHSSFTVTAQLPYFLDTEVKEFGLLVEILGKLDTG